MKTKIGPSETFLSPLAVLRLGWAWSSNVGNSFGSGFDNTNPLTNYGPLDREIRHILDLSGVVELPKRFQLGWTVTYNSKPPFSAFVGGIDLNGDGTIGDLLPGTTVNQFNRGLDTVRLRQRVTKGPGSRAAGVAMAFRLIESAQPGGAR